VIRAGIGAPTTKDHLAAARRWWPLVEGLTVVVLEQPSMWLMALAGFLVRGGVVVFALPIVVLPSAVGMANFIGPTSVTAAGPAGRLIALFAVGLVLAAVWVCLAAVVGSVADRTLILAHLDSMGISPSGGRQGGLLDLIAVRLLLLLPLAVVVGWASGRLADAGYQELILPTNLSTPLFLRVFLRASDVIAAIAVVWLASESLAAMAVRSAVIDGRRPGRAVWNAALHVARRPASVVATTLLTAAVSVAVLVPVAVALSISWSALRYALLEGPGVVTVVFALAGFLTVWLSGLLAAAVLAAWRSALWTGEMARFHIARSGDR
jgi:hypothetical protein